MPDSVEVIESKRNRDAVQSRIQTWLDNNSTVSSVDQVKTVYEMNDRVGIAILYTA